MDMSVVGMQTVATRPEAALLLNAIGGGVARAGARKHVILHHTCKLACTGRLGRISAVGATVRPQVGAVEEKQARGRRRDSPDFSAPRLFVGLPLDVVSDCNSVNHAKAISAGLRALKLLGVHGVEVPIWWGVVEKESMGKYEWRSYLSLTEMIRDAGLCVRASLRFYGSSSPAIPLPTWVSAVGETNPDIYYSNKEGKRYKECISLAADDLPLFNGRTTIQAYEEFCRSFRDTFAEFLGTTIMDVSIGLGPDGELRYPSSPPAKSGKFSGVGEFQCFDKNMLKCLKEHADRTGNPLWGLSGPHDAPRSDQAPDSAQFFKENGGSWDTSYGRFFLTWYSEQLLSHGDRLLSAASTVFESSPGVTLSAKIPLMQPWYKTRSHASELTAGYYNIDGRDGYEAAAELFARHNCTMSVTGMDLSDEHQSQLSRCSPESLLAQIISACGRHGVSVSGENYAVSGGADGFAKIKSNIAAAGSQMDSFTYQRMGAFFFSPEHWPKFTEFIRGVNRPKMDADDKVSEHAKSLVAAGGMKQASHQMQVA